MDMKKLLESIDSMASAEKKPTGPKFPGYWRGKDPASKSKTKMVGSAEESILKDLHNTAKQKVTEWALEEAYRKFNEVESDSKSEYTGVDPVARQRMGMQPATQGEIQSYLDKNPPTVQTSTGEPVRSGTGAPVAAGGQVDVARAADAASPDRTQSMARTPVVKPPELPATAQPSNVQSVPPATATQIAPQTPVSPTTIAAVQPTKPEPTAPAKPTRPSLEIPPMPKNPASGSWQELWKLNPDIKNPHKIYPGQQIALPGTTEKHVVAPGDTLDKIAGMVRRGDIGGPSANPPAASGNSAQTTRTLTPNTPTAGTQPSTATQVTGHAPGTILFRDIRNPNKPNEPMKVGFVKQSDGTYKSTDGKFKVSKPTDIQTLDSSQSNINFQNPKYADRYQQLDPDFRSRVERVAKDSGIPLTVSSAGRTPEEQAALYRSGKTPARPGSSRHEVNTALDANPESIRQLHSWLQKNDPEGKIYGLKTGLSFRTPSPHHLEMVKEMNFNDLVKRIRDIDRKEQVDEYENAQDPNAQVTSQPDPTGSKATSMDQQAAADKEQAIDVATAKGTMSGLKTALGPKVDTNALTNAVTKISDGKPLTAPEATSMSALTPLISKAAETPQTAMALKTALSNAALLAKQGK